MDPGRVAEYCHNRRILKATAIDHVKLECHRRMIVWRSQGELVAGRTEVGGTTSVSKRESHDSLDREI